MSLKAFFKDSKNLLFLALLAGMLACGSKNHEKAGIDKNVAAKEIPKNIKVGAERIEKYLPLLEGKKVAVVANQSSLIRNTHLVDSLLSLAVDIHCVFAPEHGFRGKEDAGAIIKDGKDVRTGLDIISLHGKSKKPSVAQLEDVDLVVFDLQDVGARFFTYISSLHYLMEACAENQIPLLILDRPNPNGHYIDGPILEMKHRSFVGMHPIPIIHGMTIGEYGQMINGELWLANQVTCDLQVITCENYTHQDSYELPVRPSPNLPNMQSINLYSSLCFFEGTPVSLGRGTDFPFQVYGSPEWENESFQFTPRPSFGAKHPKNDGKICYGEDLRNYKRLDHINLEWLVAAYHKSDSTNFFTPHFTLLAGTDKLKQQITAGMTAKEIRDSWQSDLRLFQQKRAKYLLYK